MGKQPSTRREFVRTAGGALAAIAVGSACGDDGGAGVLGLRITVAGLNATAPNGGTVSILRVGSGEDPAVVEVPAGGTLDHPTSAGEHEVSYSAPTGFVVTPGQPTVRTVTVEGPGTPVEFQVQVATVAAGVLFYSDWSTALGTGPDALLDTGKTKPWGIEIGNGNVNEVVAATGLAFPTANVLRCLAEFTGGDAAPTQLFRVENADAYWPVPAVGQSLFYRWYIRVVEPDSFGGDDQTHPIQDGTASGDSNWQQEVVTHPDGTWHLRWNMSVGSRFNDSTRLSKNHTYRVECQVHRIDAGNFNFHVKVFDQSGAQVRDDGDFVSAANGTTTFADNPPIPFEDVANLGGLNCGHNGVSTGLTAHGQHLPLYYQGGFCVRADDWCGPYTGA